VHWKAHPMFQLAAVVVKAGLVQLPLAWVGPSSNLAGEETGAEVVVVVCVDDTVVVVDEPGVVVVELPAPDPWPSVVVVFAPAEPDSAGNVDAPPLVLALDEAGVPTV
jgi:hypothetical protein